MLTGVTKTTLTILAPAKAPITLSALFFSPSMPEPGTRSATPREAEPTFSTPTGKKEYQKSNPMLRHSISEIVIFVSFLRSHACAASQ